MNKTFKLIDLEIRRKNLQTLLRRTYDEKTRSNISRELTIIGKLINDEKDKIIIRDDKKITTDKIIKPDNKLSKIKVDFLISNKEHMSIYEAGKCKRNTLNYND